MGEIPTVFFIGALLMAGLPRAAIADGEQPALANAGAEASRERDPVALYTHAIIDRMDADNNGFVSKQEFMSFMSEEFDSLDSDHKGKQEFLELMSKEFDKLDANHDGKLHQSEMLNKEIVRPAPAGAPHL